MVRSLILAVLCVFTATPDAVLAGSHAPIPPASYYRPYRYVRPVCPIGARGPGCFAPVRKSVGFVGRVAVRTVRLAGRAVVGTARVVGRVAVGAVRGLFGRRFY